MWRSCAQEPQSSRLRRGPFGAILGDADGAGAARRTGRVISSVQASSSIRDGGSDATPCEASVRRKSTGSPPAPDERQRCRVMHSRLRRWRVLGIDVGGTFTDAVLLPRRRGPHGEGADGCRAGGIRGRGGARGRRRGRRALHARDDGGDERAARAQGRAHGVRRRRRASSICCTCGARTVRRCTGSAREHPEPLVPLERCVGVRGRIGPDGRDRAARPRLAAGARRGGRGGLPPLRVPRRAHERAVAEELRRRLPDAHVVASHEVAPEFREYERASTTAIDAYLGPVVVALPARARRARAREAGLPEPLVMRSSGGVASLEEAAAHPAVALVSGPAAGVVGAARSRGARASRRDRVRHGRDVDGRLPDRRRRGGARGRARRRRLPGAAADRRPAHGRRRRRVDRLARTRAARCASGRRAPAPIPGRRATGAAARGRRSRTRTCCSGGCRARLAGGVELDRGGGGAGARRASIPPTRSRS